MTDKVTNGNIERDAKNALPAGSSIAAVREEARSISTASIPSAAPVPGSATGGGAEARALLVNVEVTDQNTALTLMVSFLNLAQRRGAFTFDESGKIWECLQKFKPKDSENAAATTSGGVSKRKLNE